jgi:hypothetical protein
MSSKEQVERDDKAQSKRQPSNAGRLDLFNMQLPPVLQRATLDRTHLAPQDVLHLQRTLGNQAVSRLLGSHKGSGMAVRSKNLIQRSYADVKKKATKNQDISTAELEDAIKEFLVDLVQNQGYKDSNGNPVGPNEVQNVMFLWGDGGDYAAVEGMITLPEQDEVVNDMKSDNLKMYLRHEMGHYIRSIQTTGEDDTFPEADEVIDNLDWAGLQKKYSTYLVDGNAVDRWKEEIRADLKSIRLQYRQQGRYPTDSELKAYEKGVDSIDSSHPPGSVRVGAMKTLLADLKPTGCCFLTTACVEARGLPDDCEELRVLRQFRDSYLLEKPHGEALIELYYAYSPSIVKKIDEDEERAAIYAFIYKVVRACVDSIQRKEMEYAYLIYCTMVVKLKEQFIPEEQIPRYVI